MDSFVTLSRLKKWNSKWKVKRITGADSVPFVTLYSVFDLSKCYVFVFFKKVSYLLAHCEAVEPLCHRDPSASHYSALP